MLRALVYLLLAMNLGVATWWLLRTPPPPPAPLAATEPGVPPLVLLAELDGEILAAAREDAAAPADAGPRECLEIGPFLTQADLRRAMAALTAGARRIQFRETSARVQRGYRVFLPAPPTREAALAIARGLSERGLRDYYVVTAGDDENTISLGLYRDERNARRRLEEVLAAGVDARMESRVETLAQFWIDLEAAPGHDWRGQLGGYSGVGGRVIECT